MSIVSTCSVRPQGAGWPVHVIVIEGRGELSRDPLTKAPPPLLKTWEEVGAKLHGIEQADPAGAKARVPVQNRPPGGATPEGVPNPQQEMSWAENRLLHENLMGFDPSRKSPAIWTDQTIARNPDLMDQSVTLSKMNADCLVTLWSATVSRSGKLTPLPFDVGIDPGYRLHVSERLLVQKDGPMLEAIKALSGGLLRPA
jgi:hypothetical protein